MPAAPARHSRLSAATEPVARLISVWWVRELALGAVLVLGVPLLLRVLLGGGIDTRKSFGGFVLMVASMLLVAAALWLYGWWVSTMTAHPQAAEAPDEHEPAPWTDAGPYAYTRNPSRLALVALVVAQPLWLASPWLIAYAIMVVLGMQAWTAWRHEPFLAARHGDAWAAWARSTPRWLPWRSLANDARDVGEAAWRLARRR